MITVEFYEVGKPELLDRCEMPQVPDIGQDVTLEVDGRPLDGRVVAVRWSPQKTNAAQCALVVTPSLTTDEWKQLMLPEVK